MTKIELLDWNYKGHLSMFDGGIESDIEIIVAKVNELVEAFNELPTPPINKTTRAKLSKRSSE